MGQLILGFVCILGLMGLITLVTVGLVHFIIDSSNGEPPDLKDVKTRYLFSELAWRMSGNSANIDGIRIGKICEAAKDFLTDEELERDGH